jgi:hypothetical protein
MDGHQLLPFRKFEVHDRSDDLDAGIADKDIEGTECADDLRGAGLDLLLIGDIHRDCDRSLAGRIEFPGGCIRGLSVEVGNRNLRAFARKDDRDFLADAAGGTGDDGHFVLQPHGKFLSLTPTSEFNGDSRARPCPNRE